MQSQFDFMNFISQGGPVTMMVALSLVIMSVASWYLMILKGYQAMRLNRSYAADDLAFWDAPSLEAALRQANVASPIGRLAEQAIEAAEHHQQHASKRLGDACNKDEFVARVMRRVIGQENAKLETGLTILASVGSVAPFVGLFGTVWGIYHALVSISISGQATLDKVAGPVGEALIMTALGLAVAIPAVLAYNALVRSNRTLSAQLESFAHDLHILLTTGAAMTSISKPRRSGSAKASLHLQEVGA